MSKPMVLTKENLIAAMEGRKTMSRRIIKPQPVMDKIESFGESWSWRKSSKDRFSGVTYKQLISDKGLLYPGRARYSVGDEVYVAEGYKFKYANLSQFSLVARTVSGRYTSDDSKFEMQLTEKEWKLFKARKDPYRHNAGRSMYKSLARTFMTITEVRVERLQEISMDDCIDEGIIYGGEGTHYQLTAGKFQILWNSIHGDGAFKLNPWVFVYKWGEVERR